MCWVRREGGGYGGLAYYAIRRGPYKLVQPGPFSPLELYNVEEDPGETTPLPHNHPRFQGLLGELRDHVNASGVVPWQRPE
jgi:arylsulfatase A-like enzyme